MTSDLPAGWCAIPLADCVLPVASLDPATRPEDEFTYCDISAIDNDIGKVVAPKLLKGREAPSRARQAVHAGDVLFSTVRPGLRAIARVPDAANPVASTGFCVLRAAQGVDGAYLYQLARSDQFLQQVLPLQRGVSYPAVRDADVLTQVVPVPPSAEQRRIVSKLEELLSDLDAGVAELKAAQRKLQQYRQSLLKAAVEGSLTAAWREAHLAPEETGADLLARILVERRARWESQQLAKFEAQGKAPPKGWQGKYPEPVGPDRNDLPKLPADWTWASVDQLSRSVRNGVSSTPNKDAVGLPILRINAVRPMQVRLDEIRHLDVPAGEVSDYFVEDGDLLATRYNGSVDLLGVFGLVRGVTGPVLHPDKLIRMKPVLDRVLGPWLEIAANAGASRRYIVGRVKTTAGQTGISGEDLKKMPIPLPPLAEQSFVAEQIALLLAAVELQVNFVEHGLTQSTAQRQNLLRAAFAGQLVPQDPADEPAAELLARIRAERAAAQPAARGPRSSRVSA